MKKPSEEPEFQFLEDGLINIFLYVATAAAALLHAALAVIMWAFEDKSSNDK